MNQLRLDQLPFIALEEIASHVHPNDLLTKVRPTCRTLSATVDRLMRVPSFAFRNLCNVVPLLSEAVADSTTPAISAIQWTCLPVAYWRALISLRGGVDNWVRRELIKFGPKKVFMQCGDTFLLRNRDTKISTAIRGIVAACADLSTEKNGRKFDISCSDYLILQMAAFYGEVDDLLVLLSSGPEVVASSVATSVLKTLPWETYPDYSTGELIPTLINLIGASNMDKMVANIFFDWEYGHLSETNLEHLVIMLIERNVIAYSETMNKAFGLSVTRSARRLFDLTYPRPEVDPAREGNAAIRDAVLNGDSEMVKILTKNSRVDPKLAIRGQWELPGLAQSRHIDVMIYMIEDGRMVFESDDICQIGHLDGGIALDRLLASDRALSWHRDLFWRRRPLDSTS
ncbi:hypothetical protein HK101_001241 [Irineochytrium annulatum]|nr:hypothetical protein HK101_001241 [Irineochytrium annulatum]